MLRKKIFLLIALITILAVCLISATAIFANSPPVSVTVDGQQVQFDDQQPVIIDGRTLVPVRGVFEALGFDVDWDPSARQATLLMFLHKLLAGELCFLSVPCLKVSDIMCIGIVLLEL